MADNPAIHLIEPDFVSVFHGFVVLTAHDNIAMGLKQAHHLFLSRDGLLLQNAALGLIDHPLDQGHILFQLAFQALFGSLGLSANLLQDSLSVGYARLGHLDQLLVELLASSFGFLAALTEGLPDLARDVSGSLGQIFPNRLRGRPELVDLLDDAGQDAHPIGQLAIVAGGMNIRLHYPAIGPQLFAFRNLWDPSVGSVEESR